MTTTSILTVVPAQEATAAPGGVRRASAAKSVVTVPRKTVKPDGLAGPRTLGVDGKPLSSARPGRVIWPEGGQATVAVPDGGAAAKVGTTAVAVAPPSRRAARAGGGTPDRVKVTAYGGDTARTLGGYGTAFQVARADGRSGPAAVGIRVDVSGFADAFGGRGAFENEEQLAKTLVHERVHVEDLRAGMPYPTTYDAGSAAETRAEAIANAWWESFH